MHPGLSDRRRQVPSVSWGSLPPFEGSLMMENGWQGTGPGLFLKTHTSTSFCCSHCFLPQHGEILKNLVPDGETESANILPQIFCLISVQLFKDKRKKCEGTTIYFCRIFHLEQRPPSVPLSPEACASGLRGAGPLEFFLHQATPSWLPLPRAFELMEEDLESGLVLRVGPETHKVKTIS